jgi:hypothetical protein
VALIKKRLNVESVCIPGETGQSDVIADGETMAKRGGNWFARRLGAGHPALDEVVEQLAQKRQRQTPK